MRIYTIGFTGKSAEQFFELLKNAGVRRVLDIRLRNTSQLSAFAKAPDLKYFLRVILGIDYMHLPDLAPSDDLLDGYKKAKGTWEAYEVGFVALMAHRRVEEKVDRRVLEDGCLLCSEHKPDHCHRRVVADYLRSKWSDIDIVHLV
jgi:uncharacterized protein (DUF488 family)